MKLEFLGQILGKKLNIKYNENPPSGSRVVPCGQTDRQTDVTKLIVAFRNFANAPAIGSSRKWDEVTWSGLIWVRTGTSGGLL
jgi:hypothetical protein